MGYSDAIERETAWLSTEPLAGFPPLLIAGNNGGHFDFIGERSRRLAQNPRQIHVLREHVHETRQSTGTKRLDYDMLLGILWSQQLNPEQGHVEQKALDDALEALMARIRGTLTDHTHGNRFWSAGEDGGVKTGSAIEVVYPDWRTSVSPGDTPLAVPRAYVVEVRYPAVEFVEG